MPGTHVKPRAASYEGYGHDGVFAAHWTGLESATASTYSVAMPLAPIVNAMFALLWWCEQHQRSADEPGRQTRITAAT